MAEWREFDAAHYLDSEEMIQEYLAACEELHDETLMRVAIADAARARMALQAAHAASKKESALSVG